MTIRTGYIGLGNMGKPMARCWVRAGSPLAVYDVVAEPVAELEAAGAKGVASPRAVAEAADVIGICVRDDADVRAVVLGDDGVLAGASAGTVVMIHSTVQPATVEAMAQAAAERDVSVIDAAVTGGSARAETGDLAVMAGGDRAALDRARPVLESSARSGIFHCGRLGDGMRCKLCINVVTYLEFLAGFEGMRLAKASGLSPETFVEIGLANGQITPMLQRYLTSHSLPEEAIRSEDFQKLMTNHTLVAEKDLACALELGRANGVSLPGAALASQLMGRIYNVLDRS